MLKLAGETGAPLATVTRFATVNYHYKDSYDLEAATTAISATSEPGTPDYSYAGTIPAPVNAKMNWLQFAARVLTTIDSFNAGCTHLYCRVYIDTLDAGHRLFDIDYSSIGAKINATRFTSGVIFNAMNDGAEHTIKFCYWVDAGNAVISLVQAQWGVGNDGTTRRKIVQITHEGMISGVHFSVLRGSGTGNSSLGDTLGSGNLIYLETASGAPSILLCVVIDDIYIYTYSTVNTDVVFLNYYIFTVLNFI